LLEHQNKNYHSLPYLSIFSISISSRTLPRPSTAEIQKNPTTGYELSFETIRFVGEFEREIANNSLNPPGLLI